MGSNPLIEFAAHCAVTQPGTSTFTPYSEAERACYKEAVKRITIARARREKLRTEYNLDEVVVDVRHPDASEVLRVQDFPATRPRERREQQHVSRSTSSADSGDDPPDRPGKRPRSDGAARLLSRVNVGLSPEALPHAASLVLALDEAANCEAMA